MNYGRDEGAPIMTTLPKRQRYGDGFIVGIPVLEKLIGYIPGGSLIVVLGHPGAGKTTFASKLVYENIRVLGHKAVYISFAETKEKYLEQMKRLGMDFESLINAGKFRYVHLPTVAGRECLDEIVAMMTNFITEGFRIFVIDSITPLLKLLSDTQARALLHGTLYSLINTTGSLLIAIADLPWGEESVELGGLEFVADGVLLFKAKLENGLLVRTMEIRKFRGHAIPLAEIPFTIVEGLGLRFYPYVPPEEIPPLDPHSLFSSGCQLLDDAWGRIPKGSSISILYPVGINIPSTVLGVIAKLVLSNNFKLGIVSFEISGDALLTAIKLTASMYGLDPDKLDRLVVMKRSFNPTSYSSYELVGNLISSIEMTKPDIVILHGLLPLLRIYGSESSVRMLYNLWLFLKANGITSIKLTESVIRMERNTPSVEPIELAMFSDVVHIVVPITEGYTATLYHVVLKSIPRFVSGLRDRDRPLFIPDERLAHVCLGEYIAPS